MHIESFSEVVDEVISVAHTQVWCAVGTVDSRNRPHVRILHPIWEKTADSATGWLLTTRTSPKSKHLEHSPYVSLCYDRDIVKPITLDCHAEWADGMEDKTRIWDWFKREPAPLGYDPGLIWKTIDNPELGLLKMTPFRATLGQLGGTWRYWRTD